MGSFSAYDISESAPEKWRPGEQLAASGFVAIIIYLFFDINLGIYRIFKKRQGLYFWCMLLGSWGCLIDAIAVILRFFLLNTENLTPEHLWPLYTFFILIGWTIYAPAQLLVLYSRLHLVNHNRRLQGWMLIMIVVSASSMIIPAWSLDWQAYDPYNDHLSALYSPREAILDRCTQLGYTIAESILSGVYIWSLARLLNLKSSVRQRRVMMDLIYVNVIAICLDVLTVVLVFINETGIEHPVQTFSYILKLKLEFLVLNQLMAVAARGVQKENFAERRYHRPSQLAEKTSSFKDDSKTSGLELESAEESQSNTDSVKELVIPSPALSHVKKATSDDSASPNAYNGADRGNWPMKAKFKKPRSKEADNHLEEDEEEEIGIHMWEKHGKLVMEVPWFKVDGQA